MNRLIILVLSTLFLSQCSVNEKLRAWDKKEKEVEVQPNIQKVFSEEKKMTTEFNQDLKLDLTKIQTSNKIIDNKNNYGAQKYNGDFTKVGSYKFSKLEDINQLNFKPIFLEDGLIFFDKKGTIIRYNNNKKIVWKNNHYSKPEKK